jgi:hypothetical protein
MKQFDNSKDVYDAGYALPSYSVERDTRAWRYRDQVFETPTSVVVEQVLLAEHVLDVLPMDKL